MSFKDWIFKCRFSVSWEQLITQKVETPFQKEIQRHRVLPQLTKRKLEDINPLSCSCLFILFILLRKLTFNMTLYYSTPSLNWPQNFWGNVDVSARNFESIDTLTWVVNYNVSRSCFTSGIRSVLLSLRFHRWGNSGKEMVSFGQK